MTSCYLDGLDNFGNPRLERNKRYLDWYSKIREDIGFEKIFLVDNASPENLIEKLNPSSLWRDNKQEFFEAKDLGENFQVIVARHSRHLPSGEHLNYPYCWRALNFIGTLLNIYDKVVFIDSDCFVLKRSFSRYLSGINSGWVCFREHIYGFPTSELHVVCRDSQQIYSKISLKHYSEYVGLTMEHALPFTRIEETFYGGRFGEKKTEQTDEMDFYGQANLETTLTYREDI